MKVFFLIYFMLCALSSNSQTGFMDHHYFWTETYTCFGLPPAIGSSRFTIDSIPIEVEDKLFYQILESPTLSGDNFGGTFNYISRLDSNKVYFYDGFATKLLFDYELQVGDT